MEMHNIYSLPENAGTVKQMKSRLKELQVMYKDPILEKYPL